MTEPSTSLSTRIFSQFAHVKEAHFLPDHIRQPYDELNGVETFSELRPLFTSSKLRDMKRLPQSLRTINRDYDKFQESLWETQNVFSSEEDYI